MINLIKEIKENKYLKNLLIITLFIYLPSLYFSFFIFDDNHNIILNSRVSNLSDLILPWTKSKIPLSYNYWQVLHLVFGTSSPPTLRFLNIILHLLNGVLVFKLLPLKKNEKTLGAIATGIFLLHPVVVQSVVWLSSSRELFATFFTLLAAHLIVRSNLDSKTIFKAFSLLIISILFKPISAAAPLIFLGYIHQKKKEIFYPLIFTSTLILIAIFYFYFNEIMKATTIFNYTFSKSLGIAAISISYYFRNFFTPFFLEYNYNLTPEKAISLYSSPRILLHLVYLLLPITSLFLFKEKKKELLICLLSFLTLITINTGLIPFNHQFISTVTDRYLYLPSIALVFFLYFLLSNIPKERYFQLSVILFVPLIFLSTIEVSKWKDSSTRLYKNKFSNEVEFITYINALIKDGKLEKAQALTNKLFEGRNSIDELNLELSIFQASYKDTKPKDFTKKIHFQIEEIPLDLYPLLANYSYYNNDFHLARLSYVYSKKSEFKYLLDFDMNQLAQREKSYYDKILREVTLLPLVQKNKYLSRKIYKTLRPLVDNKTKYDLEVNKQLSEN
ncbi:hypothetical protein [Halobacteriovorax sp. JY17]|uniref:hypothetical protein n=1 Tax=Halobacteriovorax sp. JY17 TaxID=2014617 RepID=UPI000C3C0DEA|nr:hypothetical protein [Halobacteriovorax sp. JY17]PIK14037.1 MAG: hypothetical protein CES88_13720 [Halobacteriovorax sp. JY17]